MANNPKNTNSAKDTDTGDLPDNPSSSDVLPAGNGPDGIEGKGGEGDTQGDADIDGEPDDGLVSVVVLKGHTLYHDGEKYPPTSRVRVSPDDADSLKKRGVVLLYRELLAQVVGYAG